MNYFRNVKPKDLGELFDYKITIPGEFGGEPVKLVNGLAFNGNIRIAVEDPVSRETVDIFNPKNILDKKGDDVYKYVLAEL